MDGSTQDNDPVCQFCWQGSEMEEISGPLHAEKSDSGKLISAHHRCMQYASGLTQYKSQVFGGFEISEVEKEITRGNKLRCAICKLVKGRMSRGASCGCAVRYCRKSFHFTCASTDREAITKRLVVTRDKAGSPEKFVLYRVFCSAAHEAAFRKTLETDLRGKSRKRESDTAKDKTGKHMEEETTVTTTVLPNHIHDTDLGSDTGDMLPQSATAASVPPSAVDASSMLDISTDDGSTSFEQNDDLAASKENDCIISSPAISNSTYPTKEGRKVASAQPLLCRLTEELSNMSQPAEKPELCSHFSDKLPPQQVLDGSKEPNGWLLRVADCSSIKKKCPGFPEDLNKTPEKLTGALKDCFVHLRNGRVHSEKSCKDKTAKRPAKRMSSRLQTEHCKVAKESEHSPVMQEKKEQLKIQPNSASGCSPSAAKSQLPKSCNPSANVTVHTQEKSTNSRGTVKDSAGSSISQKLAQHTDSKKADSGECQPKPESPSKGHVNVLSKDESQVEIDFSQQKKHTVIEYCSQDIDSAHRKHTSTDALSYQSQESILLIPSDMEGFEQWESQVTALAAQTMRVKEECISVWQKVTMKSLPSPLLLFFLLDIVKELESGNNEAVLSLLFDAEFLASRLNNFVIAQMQVFSNTNDKQLQQDVQTALISGLERSVQSLPMVHLLHANDCDSQTPVTLAIEVRHFQLSHLMLASLQAYKGLFWWDSSTAAAPVQLSVREQQIAVESETLALKMWLTKVNPITEVTVLPSDEVLLDDGQSAASQEFFRLSSYLREKTHAAVMMEGDGGASVQGVIPLLIFQPVDFLLLNFQEYLRKTCRKFFQSRGLVTALALVPLSNLHGHSSASISALMSSGERGDDGYTVSVYSAFCPSTHLTSIVLLEISHSQPLDSVVMLTDCDTPDQIDTSTTKRKRGRPRKQKS